MATRAASRVSVVTHRRPRSRRRVVVGDRVYMFTYFSYVGAPDGPSEADVRALFDAFVATIQLDPAGGGLTEPGLTPSDYAFATTRRDFEQRPSLIPLEG